MSDPLEIPATIAAPPAPAGFSLGRRFLLWGVVSFAVPLMLLRFPVFLFHLFYFPRVLPLHMFYILSFGSSLALWYGLRLGRRTTWGLSLTMALSGSFVLVFVAALIMSGFTGLSALGSD